MFAINNVIQTFPLLEEIEKDRPCFSQAEKQTLYRIAFHKADFEDVRKIIMQAAAPHLKEQERKQLLTLHEESLPKPPNAAAEQIENYIFQMHLMIYEKEKVNHMLEEVLKQSGLEKALDDLIAKVKEKAEDVPIRKAATPGKAI